jgi:hypothetical protein
MPRELEPVTGNAASEGTTAAAEELAGSPGVVGWLGLAVAVVLAELETVAVADTVGETVTVGDVLAVGEALAETLALGVSDAAGSSAACAGAARVSTVAAARTGASMRERTGERLSVRSHPTAPGSEDGHVAVAGAGRPVNFPDLSPQVTAWIHPHHGVGVVTYPGSSPELTNTSTARSHSRSPGVPPCPDARA